MNRNRLFLFRNLHCCRRIIIAALAFFPLLMLLELRRDRALINLRLQSLTPSQAHPILRAHVVPDVTRLRRIAPAERLGKLLLWRLTVME